MIDQGARISVCARGGGVPAICRDAAYYAARRVERLCVQLRDVGHGDVPSVSRACPDDASRSGVGAVVEVGGEGGVAPFPPSARGNGRPQRTPISAAWPYQLAGLTDMGRYAWFIGGRGISAVAASGAASIPGFIAGLGMSP
jgi:hypothetical protein